MLLCALLLSVGASADGPPADEEADLPISGLDGPPPDLADYGVFYNRYEPTFYTGFAPRARDPKRLHLHVGRGNQLRVTLVLSDAVIQAYVDDLPARYRGYRELINSGRLELIQNQAFEQFEQTLREHQLETLQATQDKRLFSRHRRRTVCWSVRDQRPTL